jgi:putative membrane protein
MDFSMILQCTWVAVAGMALAAVASLIPGLHIYNVIALTMVIVFTVEEVFAGVDPMVLTCFLVGLVVGFSMLFTISSQFFQPCDDSARYIMLPHEKFLFDRRGHEAVLLASVGSLVAILFIGIIIPIIGPHMGFVREILRPHLYWIIGAVIVFLLMTEWPKDPGTGPTVATRMFDGWGSILIGYLCFLLSSALGIFTFYRTTIPVDAAFQSLMPVFVGLFAIPSQLVTILAAVAYPKQHVARSVELYGEDVIRGSASGLLAGMFASMTPSMTPGPAMLLSGHATVTGGDRQFIIGGGAGRVMYYVGALLFFFMPGVFLRRGGAAINISLVFIPETEAQYYVITGLIALTGGLSFLLMFGYSRMVLWIASKVNYKLISAAGMAVMIGLVYHVTSWQGLVIMTAATFLGLIPNYWHTRRITLLSVLLVPMFLNMSGLGSDVARWLGFM